MTYIPSFIKIGSSIQKLKGYTDTQHGDRISLKKKLNSVAVVRKRTIPTERPPLVGEVSANISG
jgi:hypothetical protein